MERAFKLAAAPDRHACLGAILEPLTLGHVRLLRVYNSPFITGSTPDLLDLFAAVFVCCQHHSVARKYLHKWYLPLILRFWGWRWRDKSRHESQWKAFEAYWKDALEHASIVPDNRFQPRECGSPWELRMVVQLMEYFHYTEEQAWDMPVVKADCLCMVRAELRGEVKLWTERHEQFWDFARRMDEERFGKSKDN